MEKKLNVWVKLENILKTQSTKRFITVKDYPLNKDTEVLVYYATQENKLQVAEITRSLPHLTYDKSNWVDTREEIEAWLDSRNIELEVADYTAIQQFLGNYKRVEPYLR